MGTIAFQITSLTIFFYSTVNSDAYQRKHQSVASLAFVRGPVNSPHKWPVTRKMFPFDGVIMKWSLWLSNCNAIHWESPAVSHRTLLWRRNGHDGVSNHQPHDCLLNRLFRPRSKKTSKLRVTGLCVDNSPGTGEFSAYMASNAENISIWWRHHVSVFLDL